MPPSIGVVTGLPLKFIRAEAAVLFVFSIGLFSLQGLDWWIYPVLLLVPDVSMVGYVASSAVGAFFYNLGHSVAGPLVLLLLGYVGASPLAIGLSAIWLGHIGMDRAAGYGLKHRDSFRHTHLSELPAPRR